MKTFLKRLLSRYTVRVLWDGEIVEHFSQNVADAFEWMACYPKDATVTVFRNLNGMCIARRVGHV